MGTSMKIQFENVDFNSRSGPNGFGLKLARQFVQTGHELTNENPEVRLSFIQSVNNFSPTVLRLDGIYFNSAQDWESMNEPIKRSYDHASAVVVQSEFDKKLVFRFFGERENVFVVHNGTDIGLIDKIKPAPTGLSREKVWMCASSWRPHKRLQENVRLFQEHADPDHVMIVAGNCAKEHLTIVDDRVKIIGDLTWEQMISCMKASSNFIHLAWLDHCPNVVVDARMSGCKIYCSSEGGSCEIAGTNAAIVREEPWKIGLARLYEPPLISEFLIDQNEFPLTAIDIEGVAEKYSKILRNVSK